MNIAICPGSFDPIQNGHLDIINRASMLADKVYVVIGINPSKRCTFTLDERLKMIKKVIKGIPNCSVDINYGLTVDYAKKVGANLIIKGYRNDDDLKYEQDQATKNKEMAPDIETIILKSSSKYCIISSSSIKEDIKNDKDITSFIPKQIIKYVIKKVRMSINE